MTELTGEGRACIPVGLMNTWDGLINWTKCVWKVMFKALQTFVHTKRDGYLVMTAGKSESQ